VKNRIWRIGDRRDRDVGRPPAESTKGDAVYIGIGTLIIIIILLVIFVF
jgi:hypothetical protein